MMYLVYCKKQDGCVLTIVVPWLLNYCLGYNLALQLVPWLQLLKNSCSKEQLFGTYMVSQFITLQWNLT